MVSFSRENTLLPMSSTQLFLKVNLTNLRIGISMFFISSYANLRQQIGTHPYSLRKRKSSNHIPSSMQEFFYVDISILRISNLRQRKYSSTKIFVGEFCPRIFAHNSSSAFFECVSSSKHDEPG